MSDKDREIIQTAVKRFELAQEAVSKFRREAAEDLKYCADDQWEPSARQARNQAGRPCLTDDRISPALRQITNEARQNIPAIQVNPMGDGAETDVAKVYQGLARHIEYDSDAASAYDKALWYAAASGEGFIRLISDYENENSFDQKLIIKDVPDPSAVFIDPLSTAVDGSDMEWGFIIETVDKDDYLKMYPDSEVTAQSTSMGWNTLNTRVPGWMTSNTIRIAEYYYKTYENHTLYMVQNNLTGKTATQIEPPDKQGVQEGSLVILNKRPTQVCVVNWCKINGLEVLDKQVWPGKYIPIVPVKGEEFFVQGIRFQCGAVRRVKDAQKSLNYTVSSQMEMIDLAPRAPFIAASGTLEGYEEDWRTMNTKNQAYLYYNQKDSDGNPAPAPTRNSFEAPIQAISATRLMSVDSIKSGFGIFEAAEGAQSNETSGVAIIARTKQSSNSNFHFYDNLVKSISHLGRIIINVIPTFYDTERTIRIVKPNDEQELVVINQVFGNSQEKKNDLSVGTYDVMVKTGPSYSSKRQEALINGMKLIEVYPQSGPLIADLVMNNADAEGSQLIAKRLQAAVPPEVLAATSDDEGGGNPEQQLAVTKQQLMQATNSLKALNAHAEQIETELKNEKMENNILKQKSAVELTKAEMDNEYKNKSLELQEATTELEFLVKQKELALQDRAMAIKEQQLALSAANAMSNIEGKMMDRAEKHHDRVSVKEVMEDPDVGDLSHESLDNDMGNSLGNTLGDSLGGSFDQ